MAESRFVDQRERAHDETMQLRLELAAVRDALTEAETRTARLRAERDEARCQRDEARIHRDAFRSERDQHARKLTALAEIKVWRNEDGKAFVFVEDILGVLLPASSSGARG